MITIRLTPDVLGRVRFAFSPLAEVGASLKLLADPPSMHLHDPWLRRVRGALSEPDLDLLLAVCPPGPGAPSFLFARASTMSTTFEQQVTEVASLPADHVRDEVLRAWGGTRPPVSARRLLGADGPPLLADALTRYWTAAVEPWWERMRGVLEDDLAYRSALTSQSGLYRLLNDLHSDVVVEGDTLTINRPYATDRRLGGLVLTLVPSVFAWPGLFVDDDGESFAVTYTARGAGRVWEDVNPKDLSWAVAALLGRSRSAILTLLGVPMSTTQVARVLEQSPAAVNRHLSILRDSGMVVSWRSGRNILYRRTALAVSVLAGPRAAGPRGPARIAASVRPAWGVDVPRTG